MKCFWHFSCIVLCSGEPVVAEIPVLFRDDTPPNLWWLAVLPSPNGEVQTDQGTPLHPKLYVLEGFFVYERYVVGSFKYGHRTMNLILISLTTDHWAIHFYSSSMPERLSHYPPHVNFPFSTLQVALWAIQHVICSKEEQITVELSADLTATRTQHSLTAQNRN